MKHLLTLLAILTLLASPAAAQTILPEAVGEAEVEVEMGTQAGLEAWVEDFRPRAVAAGILAATFDAALRGVEFSPKVVERDRNQNEFTKTIWDYLDTAVSEDRVALGLEAIEKHQPTRRFRGKAVRLVGSSGESFELHGLQAVERRELIFLAQPVFQGNQL
jgi:membrane-bound lytic murein transglycosylase B